MSWFSVWAHGKAGGQSATASTSTAPATKQVTMSVFDAALNKGIELFRKSPTGSAIEKTATEQKVRDILTNPLVIIGGVLVVGLLIHKLRG